MTQYTPEVRGVCARSELAILGTAWDSTYFVKCDKPVWSKYQYINTQYEGTLYFTNILADSPQ